MEIIGDIFGESNVYNNILERSFGIRVNLWVQLWEKCFCGQKLGGNIKLNFDLELRTEFRKKKFQ